MQTKDPINTMHQSLAEKTGAGPTNTLTDRLAEVMVAKVPGTLPNLKTASTALTLFPTLAVMKPAHRSADLA